MFTVFIDKVSIFEQVLHKALFLFQQFTRPKKYSSYFAAKCFEINWPIIQSLKTIFFSSKYIWTQKYGLNLLQYLSPYICWRVWLSWNIKENIRNRKWEKDRMPLWKTYIANSSYICSFLKLDNIWNYTMGLLSTILENRLLFLKVSEGARLFLFFRMAAGKKHATLLKMNSFLCIFQGFCQEFK